MDWSQNKDFDHLNPTGLMGFVSEFESSFCKCLYQDKKLNYFYFNLVGFTLFLQWFLFSFFQSENYIFLFAILFVVVRVILSITSVINERCLNHTDYLAWDKCDDKIMKIHIQWKRNQYIGWAVFFDYHSFLIYFSLLHVKIDSIVAYCRKCLAEM